MRRTRLDVVMLVMLGTASLVALACTVPNPLLDETEGELSTGSDAPDTTGSTTRPDPDGTSTSDGASTATTESVGTTETSVGDESTTGTPSCGADELCIAPAPEGWNGPVALIDTEAPDAPPGCGGSYPTASIELGYDKIDGDDTCGCACGAPNGSVCTGPQLRNFNTDDCTGSSTNFTITADCQDITDQPPSNSWRAVSIIDGGSCAAIPSGAVEDTIFSHTVALCSGAESGALCDGGRCAPVPQAPFSDQLCIWQAGEVTSCPEGPFGERRIFYGGIEQGRSCAPCTCGDPEGTCSGSMGLHTTSDCQGFVAGVVQLNGGCVQSVGTSDIVRVELNSGTRTESCEPSAPSVTGESTVTDPVTVCCQPG